MIGTHVVDGASWIWLVPACVDVAAGCDWVPKCVVMAFRCDWYPPVWCCQLDVVGAHVYGGGSWKWLVSTCVAVAVGCGWVPKCVVIAIVCDWYPLVWWCQLDVVCNRVCGSGSWVWLGAHACGGDS